MGSHLIILEGFVKMSTYHIFLCFRHCYLHSYFCHHIGNHCRYTPHYHIRTASLRKHEKLQPNRCTSLSKPICVSLSNSCNEVSLRNVMTRKCKSTLLTAGNNIASFIRALNPSLNRDDGRYNLPGFGTTSLKRA